MKPPYIGSGNGWQALQKLINRSVKLYELECDGSKENTDIEGIEGGPATIPLIAVRWTIFDSLNDMDVFTNWRSFEMPGNIHLFLTVRTVRHKWMFHFETRDKDHLRWLVCYVNTSLRGPLGVDGECFGMREGHFGITNFKDSGLHVHTLPGGTETVGNAIIMARLMGWSQSDIV